MTAQPPEKQRWPHTKWIQKRTGLDPLEQKVLAVLIPTFLYLGNDLIADNGPKRREIECEQAPRGAGQTLSLGENAVDLSVTVAGVKEPLQLGRFAVGDKIITVQDGPYPPEAHDRRSLLFATPAGKDIALITTTSSLPDHLRIECSPLIGEKQK